MQYSCTLLKQNKGTNKDELVKVTSACSSASYYAEKGEAGGSQIWGQLGLQLLASGVVGYAYVPSTHKMEAGGANFKDVPDYIAMLGFVRHCHKNKTKEDLEW